MKKRWSVLLIAALLLALLAGCSAKTMAPDSINVTTDSSSNRTEAQVTEPMQSEAYDASYALTGSGTSSAALSGDAYGGHKVILRYEISLTAEDFDALLAALDARLAEMGGYTQDSYVDGRKPEVYGDAGRTAQLTLRVPSTQAEAFVSDVKGMGTLQSAYAYTDDVTTEYFDVETRLEVLNIQLERLTNLLVQTDNLADIIELEREIARVMIEIEELTSNLRRYDGLIDYATVEVNIYEAALRSGPAAQKSIGERISEGFSDSLHGVGTFFENLFVWLIASSPVLLVLAVLAVAVWLIVRAACKRSRARKRALAEANAAQASAAQPNPINSNYYQDENKEK